MRAGAEKRRPLAFPEACGEVLAAIRFSRGLHARQAIRGLDPGGQLGLIRNQNGQAILDGKRGVASGTDQRHLFARERRLAEWVEWATETGEEGIVHQEIVWELLDLVSSCSSSTVAPFERPTPFEPGGPTSSRRSKTPTLDRARRACRRRSPGGSRVRRWASAASTPQAT